MGQRMAVMAVEQASTPRAEALIALLGRRVVSLVTLVIPIRLTVIFPRPLSPDIFQIRLRSDLRAM